MLWGALGCSDALGCSGGSGMLWGALGCSGMLWGALGCSGVLRGAPGCSGVLWGALGCFGVLWGALGCSGVLCDALGCSGVLWGALGSSGSALGSSAAFTRFPATWSFQKFPCGNCLETFRFHFRFHWKRKWKLFRFQKVSIGNGKFPHGHFSVSNSFQKFPTVSKTFPLDTFWKRKEFPHGNF